MGLAGRAHCPAYPQDTKRRFCCAAKRKGLKYNNARGFVPGRYFAGRDCTGKAGRFARGAWIYVQNNAGKRGARRGDKKSAKGKETQTGGKAPGSGCPAERRNGPGDCFCGKAGAGKRNWGACAVFSQIYLDFLRP